MKPQEFHRKLADLMREAGKANVPMFVIVGVLQCTLTDLIIQAVNQANREAVQNIAEEISKKNDSTTN